MAKFVNIAGDIINLDHVRRAYMGQAMGQPAFVIVFNDAEDSLFIRGEMALAAFEYFKSQGERVKSLIPALDADKATNVPYMHIKTVALIEHGYTYTDYGDESEERHNWDAPNNDISFPRNTFEDATQAAFEHLQKSKGL